jgi:hypothetical protein
MDVARDLPTEAAAHPLEGRINRARERLTAERAVLRDGPCRPREVEALRLKDSSGDRAYTCGCGAKNVLMELPVDLGRSAEPLRICLVCDSMHLTAKYGDG